MSKEELFQLLNEGLEAEKAGRVQPIAEAFAEIRKELEEAKPYPTSQNSSVKTK